MSPTPFVLGTAGHVDHGKTTLIAALTGHNTDRLPQEQARGISIELGFAPYTLPSGRSISVVDVPGHERFIHHMMAGVGGMDLCMLVIAADEGVMPQTQEHLDILQLLEVSAGFTVLTKVDLVDEEWLALVEQDVREALRGTFLQDSPIFRASGKTGAGLDEIAGYIDDWTQTHPPRSDLGPVRLPIDRVFSVAGHGTVVTGTLTDGALSVGQEVWIYPDRTRVKARTIQEHGQAVQKARAGERVALNLGGISKDEVQRGHIVATPEALYCGRDFVCDILTLAHARPIKHGERVHLYAGTSQSVGRLVLLDGDSIAPGQRGYLRFRAEQPLAVHVGESVVLRSFSPMHTLGGGRILELGTQTRRGQANLASTLSALATASPTERLLHALNRGQPRAWHASELMPVVWQNQAAIEGLLADLTAQGRVHRYGDRVLAQAAAERLWSRFASQLQRYFQAHPRQGSVSRETMRKRVLDGLDSRVAQALLEHWAHEGRVGLSEDRIVWPEHQARLTPEEESRCEALVRLLQRAGLQPPAAAQAVVEAQMPPDTAEDLVGVVLERGLVERVGEFLVDRQALEHAKGQLQTYVKEHGTISVSEGRDLWHVSRRYVVPLLEYFDAQKITRRRGDVRVAYDAQGASS